MAPAIRMARSATTHSSRVLPKMATRSPGSTPASTREAARARARRSHSIHDTDTHAPLRLVLSAVAAPRDRAVARKVATSVWTVMLGDDSATWASLRLVSLRSLGSTPQESDTLLGGRGAPLLPNPPAGRPVGTRDLRRYNRTATVSERFAATPAISPRR